MTYMHGAYAYEGPTSIAPPIKSTAGLTVVVGTAPVNMADATNVNKTVIAYTYAEAVKKMGYSADFESYTICEAISSHFSLFAVAPLVMINVLDPATHKKAGNATLDVKKNEAILKVSGVILSTLVVKSEDGATTYTNTADEMRYEVAFDDDGYLHIFTEVATKITVEYEQLDASLVTAADIIGGVGMDGKNKGLELVNEVFPRFREVPGIIIAPKYSTNPAVAAVMKAKAKNVNGLFQALAFADVSTAEVTDYSAVPAYKNSNNLVDPNLIIFWPKVALNGKQYHMSTQAASLANQVDGSHEGYPFEEFSNKNLQMDACVLGDGIEILLSLEQANYLNGQGIVTALNWTGGWRAWGHNTSAYPSNMDVKDRFISVRRVFIYEQNQFMLSYWEKVDKPGNPKLIENIVDSKNIDLNGKAARQFILGGRIEFVQEENPLTDLIDGSYAFHLYITPGTPAREIKALFEFDPSYFATLFG
ncbi:MAG: phage tail sheath family protein [Solibacillus sp.]